jgi:hypothetical protein
MNTCKDCLCYRACNWHIDEETDMTVEECSTGFMPKDQYVKLPAYIGQSIWRVAAERIYDPEARQWLVTKYNLAGGKVSMIQQKADKSWKIRISGPYGNVVDYTEEEFNKHIYLTEASAKEVIDKHNAELVKKEVD